MEAVGPVSALCGGNIHHHAVLQSSLWLHAHRTLGLPATARVPSCLVCVACVLAAAHQEPVLTELSVLLQDMKAGQPGLVANA